MRRIILFLSFLFGFRQSSEEYPEAKIVVPVFPLLVLLAPSYDHACSAADKLLDAKLLFGKWWSCAYDVPFWITPLTQENLATWELLKSEKIWERPKIDWMEDPDNLEKIRENWKLSCSHPMMFRYTFQFYKWADNGSPVC